MRSRVSILMLVVGCAVLPLRALALVRAKHAPVSSVQDVFKALSIRGLQLFYIGKHKQSDRIAIWGTTELTERMTHIMLNKSSNPSSIEFELRSNGSVWETEYNYKNYEVTHAFIIDPLGNDDEVFRATIDQIDELKILSGHVHRIEEDGTLLDISGKIIKTAEEGAVKCVIANEGSLACERLFFAYSNANHYLAVQRLSDRQRKIKEYLENYFRHGGGGLARIYIRQMAEDLNIEGSWYDDAKNTVIKEFKHLQKRVAQRSPDSKNNNQYICRHHFLHGGK